MDYFKIYAFDKKKRFGVNSDGGYVIADIGNVYDCYISAGVSDEESFTRDFIESYNLNDHQCFAYDGTIIAYPHEYTTNISFTRKNIGGKCDDKTTDLKKIIERHNNIFLKMDIECGEYEWLPCLTIDHLKRFAQIVIELHQVHNNAYYWYGHKKHCFEKLAETHYPVHAHGNSNQASTNGVPDVLEITYIRKDFISDPTLNKTPLPIPGLDYSNISDRPEYNLNFYPFTSS